MLFVVLLLTKNAKERKNEERKAGKRVQHKRDSCSARGAARMGRTRHSEQVDA